MPRRRNESEADRAVSALRKLLLDMPVWVGPLLAVGAFVLFRYVIPLLIGGSEREVRGAYAGISRAVAIFAPLVVLMGWVFAELDKRSRRKLLDGQTGVESLRAMNWLEFEHLVGEAYRRQRFAVEERGGGSADGGVDLVLQRGGQTTFVQCKQWKSQSVGVKIVRELYGVMTAERAETGIVVTCGRFTNDSTAFATGKPLTLVDGEALWELVRSVKQEHATPATNGAPAPKPPQQPATTQDTPACPKCGAAMVLRTARRGPNSGSQFHGCSRYPECRGTLDLKQ